MHGAHGRLDHHGLGVVESLEGPAVEPQARDRLVLGEVALNHLEDARLARAPVAVDADGQGTGAVVAQQFDHRPRDGFAIEVIDLGFVVGDQQGMTLSRTAAFQEPCCYTRSCAAGIPTRETTY